MVEDGQSVDWSLSYAVNIILSYEDRGRGRKGARRPYFPRKLMVKSMFVEEEGVMGLQGSKRWGLE